MPMTTLPNASSRYGASLGRAGRPPHPGDDSAVRMYLRRVRLDNGGYDSAGAYWGFAEPLWRYESEDGSVSDHIRARSRLEAQREIRRLMPNALVSFFGADLERPAWSVLALPYSLEDGRVGRPCGEALLIECGTAGQALRVLGRLCRLAARSPWQVFGQAPYLAGGLALSGYVGVVAPGESDLLSRNDLAARIKAESANG